MAENKRCQQRDQELTSLLDVLKNQDTVTYIHTDDFQNIFDGKSQPLIIHFQ